MNSPQHYSDAVSFRQALEDRLRKRDLGNGSVPKCNKHCPSFPPEHFFLMPPSMLVQYEGYF